MAVLRFMRKGKGNVGALADWVGKVGFNAALPHVAKHVTGGDVERAKKVVGKLKGKAKKRGTLSPKHAYGASAKGGPAAVHEPLFVKQRAFVKMCGPKFAKGKTCSTCEKPLSEEDQSGGYQSCAGCRRPRPEDQKRQIGLFAKTRPTTPEELERHRPKDAAALRGEGSRGGRVVGHTKSGKPIYAPHYLHSESQRNAIMNRGAKGYTVADHADAARALGNSADDHYRQHQAASGGGSGHDYAEYESLRRAANVHETAARVLKDKPKRQRKPKLTMPKPETKEEQRTRLRGKFGGLGTPSKAYQPPSSITNPPKRPGWDAEQHPKERCADCGARAEEHRSSDGLCPPTHTWGQPHDFPSGAGRSDQEWDTAIASHWGGTKMFKPQAKMGKALLFDAQRAFLKAGGEGSRGGQVIGHTRSGKAIYSRYGHRSHADFTKEDHEDAAKAHDDFPDASLHNRESARAHRYTAEHGTQAPVAPPGPARAPKKQKSFSEILQGKLDKHNKRGEENAAAMREMQQKIAAKRAREGKPASDPGAPAGAISLSDMMDVTREEKETARRALPPERPKAEAKKPVTPQVAAPAGSTPLGMANVELEKQREAEGGYTESGASKRKNPPKRRKDKGATAMTAGGGGEQGSLFKAQRAFLKAGAKCTGCGKSMNPAAAMLGPVCLNCTKKRHAAATGGAPPKPPIQKARVQLVSGVVFVG